MSFSILIPNYNGADLLEEYLPSVLEAALSANESFELIVADDASTDRSMDLVRTKFPKVSLYQNQKNVGFGETVNIGMTLCKYRVVVLLNNDVRVEKLFFDPLLRHFRDERTFAVVAKGLILQDGISKNESVTRLEYKDGFLHLVQPGLLNPYEQLEEVCTVAHACGGYSAFDREKFLALGGFDSLYYPFYWEDVDICYRAWKRGWQVLYEPRSIANHRCHATIYKMHQRESIEKFHIRNRLLFSWKNITDMEMLMEHARFLNVHIKTADESFKQGFYEALKKMEEVLRKRIETHSEEKYSDRDVISMSANQPVSGPSLG